MAKRMRGIYKRGNIWWCCYKTLSGRMVRESTGHTVYDNAVEYLAKQKADVKAGIAPELKKIANYTFGQLVQDYKAWAERQRSFKSKIFLINQLEEDFKDIPLRYFTTMMLEKYQTDRMKHGRRKTKKGKEIIETGNKPATINRLVATVKHMFTKAVEWDMVEEEIAKRVRKVRLLEENNRRLRYLSQDECQSLIDACEGHLRPIVVAALNTGMRKGEVLGLKWDNVDLKHGFILLDKTKNGDRRELPINDTLRSTLAGLTLRLDVKHVFYDSKTGKPYQDIKRSFTSALKRAGIKDFHFHDLRHTFASHLVMAGVDITTVKELLGHKTLTMTLRYAHLAPSHKVNAVGILDRTLNKNSTSHLLHKIKGHENVSAS